MQGSGRQPRTRPSARGRGSRRGSAYLLVLIASLLVFVIGLSGILHARARQQASGSAADQMAARLLAVSAVDLALQELSLDGNWRDSYVSGEWQPKRPLAGGSITFMLVDESDGGLPGTVRIYGLGESFDAVQICSVLVTEVTENLLVNADMEGGTSDWIPDDCTLESNAFRVHSGAASLLANTRNTPASGPQQDVTNSMESGASYYSEVWLYAAPFDQNVIVKLTLTNDAAAQTSTSFTATSVGGEYTRLSGELTPSWTGNLVLAVWEVETESGLAALYLDDVALVRPLPQVKVVSGSWRQEVEP